MKVALVVNPCSGSHNGTRKLPAIKAFLNKKQIQYDLFISKYPGHIFQICSTLDIAAFDGIAAVGGDGTNFQVINGLLTSFEPADIPPVGILPVGSGNSFAKDLQIRSLENGLAALIRCRSSKVDVCSFSQKRRKIYFANMAGLGFVTDSADTARRFKFLKSVSYIVGVLHRIIKLSSHHMELIIDGRIITGENCFIEFCNSRYTGGNMLMAPAAKINDGLMDIVVTGKLSRTDLITTLPRIYNGTHITHPAVQVIKGKKATIRTIPPKALLPDGEILGTT
ncbi:MAG: diacylglycerol kinase family lipid kinase, partial [Desulfobacterales bacterium]|nr:diacylglycerol kinase family lipid kinase [Desulfobacterales bacterium]